MNRLSHKWIIVGFILLLFGIATIGIVKSSQTRNFIDEQIPNGNLDSLITNQVDYRLMSYDYFFMYDNLVVVDSSETIIGRIVLYTNVDEIRKYWETDSTKQRTQLYKSLVEGRLRILEKKEEGRKNKRINRLLNK
jgi:hypothetical protein